MFLMRSHFPVIALATVIALGHCHCPGPAPGPAPAPAPGPAPVPDAGLSWTTARAKNALSVPTTAYVAFGADSAVGVKDWSFCAPSGDLTCSFALAPNEERDLPNGGRYANFTLSFGAAVGCGSTKAEVNVNNPAWTMDTLDVSLVDGFNVKLKISAPGTEPIGPPAGPTGNERAFGIYPLDCDVCVARKNPPCRVKACEGAACGCKAGPDPFHPHVPCQASNPRPRAYTIAVVM